MANPLDPHAAAVLEATGLDDGGTLKTADGQPLAKALARSSRRARRRAIKLVLPLLLFGLITFVVPIGQMLQRSVKND
ncbi:MAG: ABC transporter permease, partial [Paracoccus sp. (in: a-proteobacteria)]